MLYSECPLFFTEWGTETEKMKVFCRILNARLTLVGATILKFIFNASTLNLIVIPDHLFEGNFF